MVPGLWGIGGLDRLGVRLVFMLGLALLPVGLIVMFQTHRVMEDAAARLDSSLLGESLAASANERQQIARIMGLSEALALIVPNLLETPEACNDHMRRMVAQVETIVFAGFTDMTGHLACASRDVGQQTGTPELSQRQIDRLQTSVTVSAQTALTGTAALLVRHPVRAGGVGIGYVTLTLPYHSVVLGQEMTPPAAPIDVLTFDTAGTPLTSELGLRSVGGRLPANRALANLAVNHGAVFEDVDRTGEDRIYAVVPLVQGQIFALGVWPKSAWRVGVSGYLAALAFPALMWLASLAVAYFAVHRLVIRHIRTLRRNIRTFGAVRRIRPSDNTTDIPIELREVTDAFTRLTEQVLRDEADQENMLHEKDVLLKEVHHRVKNNLQLISSITNMQIRRARHGETKFMLRRLQDRVMSLATVHRSLYQASVLSEVPADELIAELARQLARSASLPEQPIDFSMKTDPVLLYPDQAVPLSLLVTEAITNAYKYIGRPAHGQPWVSLVLQQLDNGQVQLSVRNSIGTPVTAPDADEVSGLGTHLISAFVMQLGGTHVAGETADGAYEVQVVFSRADFSKDAVDAPLADTAQ